MTIKIYSHGHLTTFLSITFQTVCVTGITLKSKVIIMALINPNGDLMAIIVMINGFCMRMNLLNHLFSVNGH